MRKFKVLDVELSPGGPGPDRIWVVKYRAIVDKKWTESTVMMVARTSKEAKHKAEQRYGGKE